MGVYKVRYSPCELCHSGTANLSTIIDEDGYLINKVESCRDDCPLYKPPLIKVPDDYEVYKIGKNLYGLRSIYKGDAVGQKTT